MPAPIEKRPTSFADFVQIVEELQDKTTGGLWYRGTGKSTYKLVPGLFRHGQKKTILELSRLELQLIERFRQLSIPFHSRSLADDWETLFFMQHYRIPTRLLDWTENPFVALYFAVMSSPFRVLKSGELQFQGDAAVWVLNPVVWNKHALRHQSYDDGVLVTKAEELKGYHPVAAVKSMNKLPVAMYGTHNSPRIVAQRGVFTIFGQDVNPMEIAHNKETFPANALVKIVLTKDRLPKLRKATLSYGITESVVFPDLDGLALEIRRSFGFEA